MSEDQLQKWIIQRDRESDIRSRIIPASTERLEAANPGDGETAMDAIGAWLGNYPQLPLVEMGRISPRAVTLTFSEETTLPAPWASKLGDPYAPHDHWGITLQNAIDLPRSDEYGWQVFGLTGIGTLADGSRALFNTSRWEILQIAGTPEWAKNLILTQVMNQAAEPWSTDHDLWLIGFEDTAEKLMSFLAKEHPLHRFHVASTLQDLQAEDLNDTTATIYVMGANRDTEKHFQALQTSGLGLVTDTIITDEAMFLTQGEGGPAVLGPFRRNLEIWPNLSEGLVEKMEQAWRATEELAKQKAAETDFNAFLEQQSPDLPPDAQQAPEKARPDDPLPEKTLENAGTISTVETSEPDQVHLVGTEGQVSAAVDDEERRHHPPTDSKKNPAEDNSAIGARGDDIKLRLLGEATVATSEGELTGRHAALLVILKAAQKPVSPQFISEQLWPGDESQGHTARTRRSRLRSKVHQHTGEIIDIEDGYWTLQDDALISDYEDLIHIFVNTPITSSEVLTQACQKVTTPLAGADTWADPYRATITEDLAKALSDLKSRAVEAEEFDTAKAAKAALVHLGEA